MNVRTFYRAATWLPLLLPALAALVVHGADIRPGDDWYGKILQVLLISGVYGGVPYALLAIWGTWWIDRRPEAQIRHLALRAPLLMLVVWLVFSAVLGVLAREARMFLALFGLGAAASLMLGYLYVGLVFILREGLGRAGWLAAEE